jgi:hypothetical protein
LDFLGLAAWSETEAGALDRLQTKLPAHLAWLARHGLACPDPGTELHIIERMTGNEILFTPDRQPCDPEEVELTIRQLAATRQDLLHTLEGLPKAAFDWDPPYRAFAEWATWRSVRAILAHIANCETHYYLRAIGHRPRLAPAPPSGDWRRFLAEHREVTLGFLGEMKSSADLSRISFENGEAWSARKVLRRLVWHELLHTCSIRRIAKEYDGDVRTRR